MKDITTSLNIWEIINELDILNKNFPNNLWTPGHI